MGMWISETGTSNTFRKCHPLSVQISSCLPKFNTIYYYMKKSNNDKLMKTQEELEKRLEICQSLYDKYENNPHKQAEIQREITQILHQLKIWDDFLNVGKEEPNDNKTK
jgi:DNA repair ATPase RecN